MARAIFLGAIDYLGEILKYYVIEHPKRGVYDGHVSVPSFTWKKAKSEGKRMSKAEAEELLKERFTASHQLRRCYVSEKTE